MANFILESRLYLSDVEKGFLDRKFYAANKLYNNMVTHANELLEKVFSDENYLNFLKLYNEEKDEVLKKQYGSELNKIRAAYGLTKYDLEAYCKIQRNESLHRYIDANTAQKMAARVWQSVESCLFGNGKKVRYKKIKDLHSIEGKSNTTGIRFSKELNCVLMNNMKFPIKVRKTDTYKQKALEHDIAYCRIIRKPHKTGMKYYVQLVMKGYPPEKENRTLGNGRVGIDIGPSAIAIVSDSEVIMEKLSPNTIKSVNKQIADIQRKMDKSRRATNPNCYNEDGTIKKGAKFKYSKNYIKLRQELRNLYRIKDCYLTEYQNRLAKKIVSTGDDAAAETINFVAWMRRSKKAAEKSSKTRTITKPNGETKVISLNKKKKRFGASMMNNRPSSLMSRVAQIYGYYSKEITYLNTQKLKLSQYNHDTDTCTPVKLSDREKQIAGKTVQRDTYSAFLAYNYKDVDNIDRDRCFNTFDKFVENQNLCIRNLELRGDSYPSCMGIKNNK